MNVSKGIWGLSIGISLSVVVACGGVDAQPDPTDTAGKASGERQMWVCKGKCIETREAEHCVRLALIRISDHWSTGQGFGRDNALEDLRTNCSDQGFDHEAFQGVFFNVAEYGTCEIDGVAYQETLYDWNYVIPSYGGSWHDPCEPVPEPGASTPG